MAAFDFFGGAPISILYDNLKIAVARILGDGKRQRTRAFTELVSHYLFEDRFGRPGKGNDKGKVEGLVKYSRANFLTPVPHAASFEALNAMLEERCRARQNERASRHEKTIGERLVADKAALRDLPTTPFEPCHKYATTVSSQALVRYRLNDYSVPTVYGFRDVLVKGFVDEVAIICGASEIARHPRVYGRGEFVFDPKHYLALLEQKPGALDQAAPLQGWILPEPLQHLRRLLEARMGNRGKREFIQVLRLMEVFPETLVADAALNAIRLGAIGFDAVKQLIIAKIKRRPAHLDLRDYPYLPAPNVVREHEGEIHEVMVAPGGFYWAGQTYSSLSAIARKITGVSWNGPRFFGLREKDEPAQAEKEAMPKIAMKDERRPSRGAVRPRLKEDSPDGVAGDHG